MTIPSAHLRVAIPSYSEVLFLQEKDEKANQTADNCRNPFLFRGPIPTASLYNSFIINIIQSPLARFFISHQVNEETFRKRFFFCHIKALDKAHFSIILNNPIFTQAKRGPFSDVENFSRF